MQMSKYYCAYIGYIMKNELFNLAFIILIIIFGVQK